MQPLLETDKQAVYSALARLGLGERSLIEQHLQLFRARELARGEYLLRGGEPAIWTGVLASGLLREHFVTPRGVERTKSFVQPLQFTGSLADLLSGKPSRAFIVAEQASRVLLVRYSELRRIQSESPLWAAMARRSIEHLLMDKAEREYQFMCLDAAARYAEFLSRYGELEGSVAAAHIASYLSITPVHLSRLRARRARSAQNRRE
jgi:CRP-like cAMP-binding protein